MHTIFEKDSRFFKEIDSETLTLQYFKLRRVLPLSETYSESIHYGAFC